MKFLEELKAAQAIIEKYDESVRQPSPPKFWEDRDYWNGFLSLTYDSIDVSDEDGKPFCDVLRRIPQLIEVVEWIGEYRMNLDNNKFAFDGLSQFEKGEEHVIDQLLSKLASSDAGATRPLEGKKDE